MIEQTLNKNFWAQKFLTCLQDSKHKNGPYSINMLHGVQLKGKLCALKHFIDFFN